MLFGWSLNVSISFNDAIAQEETELAKPARYGYNITKGAVWFELLGLTTANQDS